MATHGAARQQTIDALRNRRPFKRSGFAMWATETPQDTGRLPEPYATQYKLAADAGLVIYTVMSYGTPIAWVLSAGTIVVPDVRYSVTTSVHQGLAGAYL